MGFYGSNDPTNSVKALKEDRSRGSVFKSLQSIRCTPPAHNNRTTIQHETKTHKIQTQHKRKWIYAQWNGPGVTKPKPENYKNCSSKCAYDCAQLQSTIQHRIVLTIPLLPPDKHYSSDVVCRRRGGKTRWYVTGNRRSVPSLKNISMHLTFMSNCGKYLSFRSNPFSGPAAVVFIRFPRFIRIHVYLYLCYY